MFDANATDPLTGRKGLIRLVGRDGVSREQTDPDRNNVAPRLGLTWPLPVAVISDKDKVFKRLDDIEPELKRRMSA